MLNFDIRRKYFSILAKKILDIYEIITGIPPLSLPNSKGKNLKSYSISGNVDESIIEYADGTATEGKPNLLRTAGRTEQAVSGSVSTKRILQCDKWAKLTANNNIATLTNVVIGEGSTSFAASANGYGIGFPVKLKPNHNYTAYANVSTTTTTATMNIRISFYEADGTWISTWYQGNAVNSGMTLKSFTVPSNADMTVVLCCRNNNGTGTDQILTFSDIMLVEGVYTTANAPAYTPYKQLLTEINGVGDYDNTTNKYKIPVLSAGKNLLNGTVTTNNFNANSAYLPKGTYTFSCNFNNATRWRYDVQVLDKNGNKIPSAMYNISTAMYITGSDNLKSSGDMTITSFSFSLKQSAYVSVAYSFGDTSASTTVTNAQIEAGSERTEYEPYVQPTQNNIFINNSLFKTGENVDTVNYPQNKTIKAVGKYVFTGTENIELYDNSKGFRFALSDMETGLYLDGYCNRFENFKNSADNDVPKVFFGYNNNYVYFRRFSATATTVEAIKAILADWYSNGKPLTIWYPLENETEEAISLPDIPTVQGSAAIMVDTSVQPSGMSVEYAIEGA